MKILLFVFLFINTSNAGAAEDVLSNTRAIELVLKYLENGGDRIYKVQYLKHGRYPVLPYKKQSGELVLGVGIELVSEPVFGEKHEWFWVFLSGDVTPWVQGSTNFTFAEELWGQLYPSQNIDSNPTFYSE